MVIEGSRVTGGAECGGSLRWGASKHRGAVPAHHQFSVDTECSPFAQSSPDLSCPTSSGATGFSLGISTQEQSNAAFSGENRVNCPYCHKGLRSYSGLRTHIRDQHTANKQVSCTICHKLYRNQNSLSNHMSLYHKGDTSSTNSSFRS